MGDSRACLPADHSDPKEMKETDDAIQGKIIYKNNILGKVGKDGVQNTNKGLDFANRMEILAIVPGRKKKNMAADNFTAQMQPLTTPPWPARRPSPNSLPQNRQRPNPSAFSSLPGQQSPRC